ncbi:MAG: type II secretion system protein [Phycisphaeraceae bacterium]
MRPNQSECRTGFTLVEMLVVISLIMLLIAMLMPSLRSARERARQIKCLAQMQQVSQAHRVYGDDFGQVMMPLEYAGTPPANYVINFPSTLLRWPDMLFPYAPDRDVYDCPTAAQSVRSRGRYGIGLNHIELSYSWGVKTKIKYTSITRPTRTVLFADVGSVSNYSELANPDLWEEVRGEQLIYFLTPNHGHFFSAPPPTGPGLQQRVVPRHLNNANAAFVDGHGELIKVSDMGFQYYPGVAPGGGPARGDNVIGTGNNQWDARWMWGRQ